jgi:hypothetical protein
VLALLEEAESVAPVNMGSPPDRVVAYGLPRGLQVDEQGRIFGRPEEVCDGCAVTVVAANEAGSSQSELLVTVKDAPPRISYGRVTATVGKPVEFAPASAGGQVLEYRCQGELPAGLSLDPSTGVVSGTPEQAGQRVVVITAANATGSHAVEVPIAVKRAPPCVIYGQLLDLTVGCPVGEPICPAVDGEVSARCGPNPRITAAACVCARVRAGCAVLYPGRSHVALRPLAGPGDGRHLRHARGCGQSHRPAGGRQRRRLHRGGSAHQRAAPLHRAAPEAQHDVHRPAPERTARGL